MSETGVSIGETPYESMLSARLAGRFLGEISWLAASCLKHCADQMELETARDLLRRERARIEQALARISGPEREELAGQDEMADAASQLYEEEFDEGQADDLRAELAAVERAEARLLDGTYGRSIESGEDIPDERLEAVPTAERTAEEQARFERG